MKVFMGSGALTAAKSLLPGYRVIEPEERHLIGRRENAIVYFGDMPDLTSLSWSNFLGFANTQIGEVAIVTEVRWSFLEGEPFELAFNGG